MPGTPLWEKAMSQSLLRLSSLAAGLTLLLLSLDAAAQTAAIPVGQYHLLHIDGRTDVLRAVDNKLERLDGDTLTSIWKRGLTAEDQPTLARLRTADHDPTGTLRYIRRILTTCPDLNGDGKGDCVFGLDFQPDLVAVNGTNGEVLWWHRNRVPPEGMKQGPFADDHMGDSFVLAEPLLYDVDGDRVPDLITGYSCAAVTFREPDNTEKLSKRPMETLIQAVSGRTGKLLWSWRLEPTSFNPPGGGTSFVDYFQILGRWKGAPVVTVLARGKMATLDLKTGKPVGPLVSKPGLRFGEAYPEHARFFDPDGTGELAALLLTQGKEIVKAGDPGSMPTLHVAAVRAATGEVVWEVDHEGLSLRERPQQDADAPRACDWPAPVRISTRTDDRRQDVLLSFIQQRNGLEQAFWHGVERLDGRTGRSVWRKRILLEADSSSYRRDISRLEAGPDFTGDGCPDLFVVKGMIDRRRWEANKQWVSSGLPRNELVQVTVLSGADGGLLWQRPMPDGLKTGSWGAADLEPLQWLRPPDNVRPQMVISRVDRFDGEGCFVWVVEPTTGFVRASMQGMESIEVSGKPGAVLGHVPGSWNPRRAPDQGQLVQWRPALKTDDTEAGTLPSADTRVQLQTLPAFPWQERPLPWAAARSRVWQIGAGMFIALLLILLVGQRRYRSFFVLLSLVLLISGAVSYGLLRRDCAVMDAEEFYVPDNWYGIALITATILTPFVAVYMLLLWVSHRHSPQAPSASEGTR
jgi:hypothetical protein